MVSTIHSVFFLILTTAMKYFRTRLSRQQCSDAGMAASLILLLAGIFTGRAAFYQLAVPALVINMIIPRFLVPVRHCMVWPGGTDGGCCVQVALNHGIFCAGPARWIDQETLWQGQPEIKDVPQIR